MSESEWAALTPREREVWALLADGRTDKAIGATLGIKPSTVRVYVVALAFKLAIPGGHATRVLIAQRYWSHVEGRQAA